MSKERLDVLIVKKGLMASRERAKASIMAGLVFVDGVRVDKAGTLIADNANIEVHGDSIGFVSRGGLKLAKALETFALDLRGKVMADVGASTGGFTDCALQHGASRVYAIDVGYGQLAWSLRTDKRVVNMERTNIRNVKPEDIGEQLDFASIDVAFISLEKVLPVVRTLLSPAGQVVALIKPQFEAGRSKVGKKGVVKDPLVHREVITKIVDFSRTLNFKPINLTFSPVKGPEGNIEYLLQLTCEEKEDVVTEEMIAQLVAAAHQTLA